MNAAPVRLLAVLALGLLACSSGCKNVAAVQVYGKAIEGNVSFIGVVGDQDARLKGPGVPNTRVELVAQGGPIKGVTVGEAMTDAKGDFMLRLKEPDAVKHQTEFRAEAPNHLPSTGVMLIPTTDRRVLIILRPR